MKGFEGTMTEKEKRLYNYLYELIEKYGNKDEQSLENVEKEKK